MDESQMIGRLLFVARQLIRADEDESGFSIAEAPPRHLVRTFENGTKPLRKGIVYNDEIEFMNGNQPIIGRLWGDDNGQGYLINTRFGKFRVPKERMRHPKDFSGHNNPDR